MAERLETLKQTACAVVEAALTAGADAADAVVIDGESLEASVLGGDIENIERAEARDLGLRVFAGGASAIVSTSRLERSGFAELAERALAMASAAPCDPHAGLCPAAALARDVVDLQLADDAMVDTDQLIERAKRCEAAGLAVSGVVKSAGAGASYSRQAIALAASNGFAGAYERTGHGVSAALVAGDDGGIERDWEARSSLHLADLPAAEDIGRIAGERAARRLGARKVASTRAPVVFEQRLASSLLGHLAAAINGQAVARATSFLADRLGEAIFPAGVSIVDDPLIRRGHGSRPFDGEGLASRRRTVVEDGVLQGWLLDCRSARQLGLEPTGNAGRSTAAPPAPTTSNFTMAASTTSPEALIAGIDKGLLVCELIGMGVNPVTGDYSRGASGLWIENGEIAYPVSEVTIAGNLIDMFKTLTPASDLVMRSARNAPTCLIAEMTIAGE